MKKMDVADFFCGAGGFSKGFSQKGFNVVFSLDNWKPAIETHKLNNPDSNSTLMDILELNTPKKIDEIVPDTEIIIGSPPCISFSNSNKSGKADKTLGLKLIKSFLRIIAWKKKKGVLKYWIMENVPNSQKYTKDRYSWKELGLPGKGPDLVISKKEILNSANFGAPQSRRRFVSGDFPVPNPTHNQEDFKTIKEIFHSLKNPLNKTGKYIRDPLYYFKIKSDNLTDHFYDTRVAEFEWKISKELKEDHGYMGKMSFPENINKPSRTIMATMSASTRESMIFFSFNKEGKRNGYRIPTIREAACFMSFPINYQFEGTSESSKYRLVGNAVCPKVSSALAEAILQKENIKKRKIKKKIRNFKIRDNLNGSRRKIKKLIPKKFNSKFSGHVPRLKIRNYRVSLENIYSDFENKKIKWSCVLHHGTGKNANKFETSLKKSRQLVKDIPKFNEFEKELKKSFYKLAYNKMNLHEEFLEDSLNKGPRKVLEIIKETIDKYYSGEEFKDFEIKHREKGFIIGNGSMPLRIALAFYACRYFVDKL